MIQPLFNWRTGLALIAIAIVSGTIFYSQYLARKIAGEERQKVEEYVEATKLLFIDTTGLSTRLAGIIITENKTVPIIVTDEKGNILDHVNLDSASVASDTNYVHKKLAEFRSQNPTIEWVDPLKPNEKNLVVKPGKVLPAGAVVYCKYVYINYYSGAYNQFSLLAKSGLGRHGQRNSASVGYAINIAAGLGRNFEGRLSR